MIKATCFFWGGGNFNVIGFFIFETWLVSVSMREAYFMNHQLQHLEIQCSAHTVYLCVLCGCQNKQRLFPHTALTDWFL